MENSNAPIHLQPVLGNCELKCHLPWVKKGCCSQQLLKLLLIVSPEDGNNGIIRHLATSCCAPWGDSGWKKHRIQVPGGWDAYQRSDSSEPRLLHLLLYGRVLNSLTWDIWFSLINSNLLMFQLPGLCCKNSYISWLPSCLFGAVSKSYLKSKLKSSVLTTK